jgi:hypothetical protein
VLGQLGRLLALALVVAATPARADEPRAWRYAGKIIDGEGKSRPAQLELREIGRRSVGARTVVDLAAYRRGKPIPGELEEALGIPHAPFTTLQSHFTLVLGRDKRGPYVAVLLGEEPATPERIDKVDEEWARFRPTSRPHPGASAPLDRSFRYTATFGPRQALCEAYEHPSPDTGDNYEHERCWAPGVGLVQLKFDSVWGGYELSLERAPAAPALDDPLAQSRSPSR